MNSVSVLAQLTLGRGDFDTDTQNHSKTGSINY